MSKLPDIFQTSNEESIMGSFVDNENNHNISVRFKVGPERNNDNDRSGCYCRVHIPYATQAINNL